MKTTLPLAGYRYSPAKFFLLTFVISWTFWFLSAYFSFRENSEAIFVILMLPGLIVPSAVAIWMIYRPGNSEMKRDFLKKLLNLRLIRLRTLPALLLIMPMAVVISIFISILFGQSSEQLQFAESFSFTAGFVPVLLVLFLAATFEELGWRSYAVDSLHSRYSYFTATLIFGALWSLWHLPLMFIKDYYHYELLQTNILFAVNFFVGTIPMAFILSWICRKNNGSIIAVILFHFVINLSQEALQMTQIAKCIETGVLFILAAVLVIADRKLFFDHPSAIKK